MKPTLPILALLTASLGGCLDGQSANTTNSNTAEKRYAADLTQIELRRSDNGQTVAVDGLPISSATLTQSD